MNKEQYTKILEYITRTIYINYFGEITLPTVLMTAEALQMHLDIVDDIYIELCARGILRREDEYIYKLGPHFKLSDKLKMKLGSGLTR